MKRLMVSVVMVAGLMAASMLVHAETLTVSAAASLTNAFREMGKAFEAKHPGNQVVFNFAASGVLLQQIVQGAPVDVFASADQESMDKAQAAGVINRKTRVNFLGNGLVLVVPKHSRLTITSLNDLNNPAVKRIAMGNPVTTSNGRYARAALQQAGIWQKVGPKLILAENVRQSLSYVARGEVDAGFVFSTDARQDSAKVNVALSIPAVKAGKQPGQWLPSPIAYPIAEVTNSKSRLAGRFIAFVQSSAGQAILVKYGFLSQKKLIDEMK